MIYHNVADETEVIQHPSGDLIVTLCLDPAVASQIRAVANRWDIPRLSDAAADILLVGLIAINSTSAARLS